MSTAPAADAAYATRRERIRWARCIDQLLLDAVASRRPRRRPLIDPLVVQACETPLRRVRDVLLDGHVDVRTRTLQRVEAFLCDGARSPLFGTDAAAAASGAAELRTAFCVALPPLAGAARHVA